jgi:hypothetical protein
MSRRVANAGTGRRPTAMAHTAQARPAMAPLPGDQRRRTRLDCPDPAGVAARGAHHLTGHNSYKSTVSWQGCGLCISHTIPECVVGQPTIPHEERYRPATKSSTVQPA